MPYLKDGITWPLVALISVVLVFYFFVIMKISGRRGVDFTLSVFGVKLLIHTSRLSTDKEINDVNDVRKEDEKEPGLDEL
jgi:uncharacterized membrane protein YcaP (DUF421 family)